MKRAQSINLTHFAKGKDCTLRVPGVCSYDTETTVFCHVSTKGMSAMGGKTHDFFGFIGCYNCHQWYDLWIGTKEERATFLLDAICETQGLMFAEGRMIIT